MRGLVPIIVLGVLVPTVRADVDRSGEAARAARANWVQNHTDAFRGKRAIDAEATDVRFTDGCAAPSNFRAAFELAQDGRLVFASVTIRKGKLVRGKLERFGLPVANLTAKDWDELRKDTPMALTLVSNDDAPVCLIPPKSRPRTFKAPRNRGFWGVHDPPGYLFGGLPGLIPQLGARYVASAYEVKAELKGQPPIELGPIEAGKSMSAKELVAAMRRGLGREGSEREMLDLYYTSTVTYRAIRRQER